MSLVDLGPITLACICGGAGVPCSLTALDLVVTDYFNDSMQDYEFWVSIPGHASIDVTGNGVSSLTPSEWLPYLGSATVRLRVGRSLSSDYFASGGGKFVIRATYTCIEPGGGASTTYAYSHFLGGNQVVCPDNGQGAVLGSSIATQWWHSRPLSDCTVIDFTVSGGFEPIPVDRIQGGTSGTAKWCLCASGGTGTYDPDTGITTAPAYQFMILSGVLPSGQHLNPDTGCIEGVPNGADPGTDSVTFRVLDILDPNGGHADVTCGIILPGCTGSTPTPAGNWFL